MTKLYCFLFFFLTTVLAVMAEPATPGVWKTITTTDGSTLQVQLTGDEFFHYWLSTDGRAFDDNGSLIDLSQRKVAARQRRLRHAMRRSQRLPRTESTLPIREFTGDKRGLIILVEFEDKSFRETNNLTFYQRFANEEGFTTPDGFRGSVHDYFLDQSRGLFNLTFDVVGPINVGKEYSYYGENTGPDDFDVHPGEMVITACRAIDDEVDFSDYDWDGDGIVDQVMIIYAGMGEASGGGANSIWPHEWDLTEAEGAPITLDNVTINTYACSCELGAYGKINGIGTTCHEFSHCLGLPDMYDTDYGGHLGLGAYSPMASGNYNGSSFLPAGYTSFERMCCGWLTPIVLTSELNVNGMKPLSQDGNAYILYNDGYPDEFYLLENRQQTGWDEYLPSTGLLILHVDYDETVWYYNMVNTVADFQEKPYYGPGAINDHERCNMFHANNSSYNSLYTPYPYLSNNSLTRDSSPAATLYHPNSKGELFMETGITDITQNDDGTIAFRTVSTTSNLSPIRPQEEGAWYTLDGRRLTNRPEGKGIFIYNGKKIIK